MCSRHAATGSSSSSRVQNATASQSRSTSGSPKTCVAQPSFGKATPDQLTTRVDHLLAADLDELLHLRAPDALAVEVGQQLAARGRRSSQIDAAPLCASPRSFSHSGV